MATRDPEATRQRLLDAGLREFSEKGIAGARVDAIAAAARTNKRMLYYYFGSKEGLFREILRHKLSDRAAALAGQPVTSDERLRRRQELHAADLDYVRMLVWEALEAGPTGHVVDEDERTAVYQHWIERVREQQAEGLLPADLDPGQLALSELALTLLPFLLPQVARLVTGRAVTDPAFLDERAEFLDALTRRLDSVREREVQAPAGGSSASER